MSIKVSPIIAVIFLLVSAGRIFGISYTCSDDFSSNGNCNWQPVQDRYSFFEIKNNQLEGQTSFFLQENTIFYLINQDYKDYTIEADVMSILGVDKTIIARFSDPLNYYILNLRSSFNNQGNDLLLVKHCCGGKRILLAKTAYENKSNTKYRLKLKVSGSRFRAYVNDQLLIDYYDISDTPSVFSSGIAGLAVWGGNWLSNSTSSVITRTAFDNIKFNQIEEKEVYILVPGLGASWNLSSLMSCSLTANSMNDWSLAPYAGVYDRLIDTFNNNQFAKDDKFFIYAYDWRRPMTGQADELKKYLEKLSENYSLTVNFISHSLGGLVVRAFLDRYLYYFHFNKIITLGTPHYGTALAYPMWEGGIVDYQDKGLKLAIEIILKHCNDLLKIDSDSLLIQTLVPSIKDLLPVFPYITNEQRILIDPQTMKNKNDWLLNLNDSFTAPVFTSVAGNNNDTLTSISVISPTKEELTNNIWVDGKPVFNQKEASGDGTILLKSALFQNSKNQITLPNTDHGQLIYSDSGLNAIFNSLGLTHIALEPRKKESVLNIVSRPINLDFLLDKKIEWKRYQIKF